MRALRAAGRQVQNPPPSNRKRYHLLEQCRGLDKAVVQLTSYAAEPV